MRNGNLFNRIDARLGRNRGPLLELTVRLQQHCFHTDQFIAAASQVGRQAVQFERHATPTLPDVYSSLIPRYPPFDLAEIGKLLNVL